MRFHFISSVLSPIKHERFVEEVDCTFRDAQKPDLGAPAVTITWSRTKSGDWESPVTMIDGSPEMVAAKSKILRGLMNFAEERKISLIDPDALLVALEREKSEQAVLLGRSYVPVRKIEATELMWKVVVDGQTMFQVKGAEEDDARREAGRRFMSLVDDNEELAEKLMAWIKAKKPISKVEKKDQPDTYPLSVYCRRGHQRAAAEKKDSKTKLTLPASK
jgi:hypothetical protein